MQAHEYTPGLSPLRQRLRRLTRHRFFEYFILVCILINVVTLALESPFEDNAALTAIDFAVTIGTFAPGILRRMGFGLHLWTRRRSRSRLVVEWAETAGSITDSRPICAPPRVATLDHARRPRGAHSVYL